MCLIKVYRRPFIAIVEYHLSHSLASIKGYAEVLVVQYYRYTSRRNVIRLEGYYLVLRLDTSQDLRPNLPTRFCTLASFSLASPLGSILYRIPILYPLELLAEALDQLNLVEGFQGPSIASLYRILGEPLQFPVALRRPTVLKSGQIISGISEGFSQRTLPKIAYPTTLLFVTFSGLLVQVNTLQILIKLPFQCIYNMSINQKLLVEQAFQNRQYPMSRNELKPSKLLIKLKDYPHLYSQSKSQGRKGVERSQRLQMMRLWSYLRLIY